MSMIQNDIRSNDNRSNDRKLEKDVSFLIFSFSTVSQKSRD